jgi:RimJ/RimL family protein N-acetyltransferase
VPVAGTRGNRWNGPAPGCHDGAVATALDAVAWPVRTDRLVLRPATRGDVEATWAYRRLPEVNRWLSADSLTLELYRERFEERLAEGRSLVALLDDAVIGDLMVRVEDAWAQVEVKEQARGVQAELGWVLDPVHHGHGYATEAVRALLDLCFGTLGLRRVTAGCYAGNERSWRLMERVGMRRETHTVKEALHRSGEWVDGLTYALLAEEWLGAH